MKHPENTRIGPKFLPNIISLLEVNSQDKNWDEFKHDFKLRTDAVWEKEKLRDWFRLFYKNFLFDYKLKQYFYLPPSDSFDWMFDLGAITVRKQPYLGYTGTGRTVS